MTRVKRVHSGPRIVGVRNCLRKLVNMTNTTPERREVISEIWKNILDSPAVLFDMPYANLHRQPMCAHVDKDSGLIWFLPRKTSPLVLAVRSGSNVAHLTVESADQNFHASLKGTLQEQKAKGHIEANGNQARWERYPYEINDPELTMLCFTPRSAAVWVGSESFMNFGRDLFEAKSSKSRRRLSYHVEFDF